jgi:HEAT repeat protein
MARIHVVSRTPLLVALAVSAAAASLALAEDDSQRLVNLAMAEWDRGTTRDRLHALSILESQEHRAMPALARVLGGLKDENARIRAQSAAVISGLGARAKEAIPQLVSLVDDKDLVVSEASIRALASFGASSAPAIPLIVEKLGIEPTSRGECAASTLSRIGAAAVPALVAKLKDKNARAVAGAAGALGLLRNAPALAVEPLLDALEIKDDEAHMAVISALVALGEPAAEPLARRLSGHGDRTRNGAAAVLAQLSTKAVPAIPALIRALSRHEQAPPKNSFDTNGAESFLAALGQTAPEATPVEAALASIGAFAIPPLLRELDQPDPDARACALRVLGFMGEAAWSALPRIIALLDDPTLKRKSIEALGHLRQHASGAIPALLSKLNDPDGANRAAALQALAAISADVAGNAPNGRGCPLAKVTAALRNGIRDPDARVRSASALGLADGVNDDDRSLHALVALLADSDAGVRSAAIRAVARLEPDMSVARKRLAASLRDRDARVRIAAAESVPWLNRRAVMRPAGFGAEAAQIEASLGRAAAPPDEQAADAALVSALLDLLGGTDAGARRAAVSGLMNCMQPDGPWNQPRAPAATAIHVADPVLSSVPAARKMLQPALRDADLTVRMQVATLLPRACTRAEDCLPALLSQLDDPDNNVQGAVVDAIGSMGTSAASAVPRLLRLLQDSERWPNLATEFGQRVVAALASIDPGALATCVATCLRRLDDPESRTRDHALKLIDLVPAESLVPPLLEALAKPSCSVIAQRAMLAVVAKNIQAAVEEEQKAPFLRTPDAQAAAAAIALLRFDEETATRLDAIKLLCAVGTNRQTRLEMLLQAVANGDASPLGLAPIIAPDAELLEQFLIHCLNDLDAGVRIQAVRAWQDQDRQLANGTVALRIPKTCRALCTLLDSSDAELRQEVACLLGRMAAFLADEMLANLAAQLGGEEEFDGADGARARADAVTALIPLLGDRAPTVRWTAIWALSQFGGDIERALPALAAVAKRDGERAVSARPGQLPWFTINPQSEAFALSESHEGDPVRLAAIHVLAEHAKIGLLGAAGWLVPLLDDAEERVRHEVIAALGAMGSEAQQAVPALARMLKSNAVTLRGRTDSGRAIPHYGNILSGDLAPLLPGVETEFFARQLQSTTFDDRIPIRFMAAMALQQIGPSAKAALPELVAALQDTLPEVRDLAARAIGAIGEPATSSIPELARRLISEIDDRAMHGLSAALAAFGEPAAPILVKLVSSPTPALRVRAISLLGTMGPKALMAAPELLRCARDADDDIRAKSLVTLGQLARQCDVAGVDTLLLESLKDDDFNVRSAAAVGLGKLGPKCRQSAAALVALCKPEHEAMSPAAAQALLEIGATAVPTLLAGLREPQQEIKDRTLQLLTAFASLEPFAPEEPPEHARERAIDSRATLLFSLGNPDPQIRAGVAQVLAGLGENIISDLIGAVRSPVDLVRVEAINALKLMGPTASGAASAIKAAVDDPDPAVRKAAKEAIEAITGGVH